MSPPDVPATAMARNWPTLSPSSRSTLATLRRQPVADDLGLLAAVALFSRLGQVRHAANYGVDVAIGDQQHHILQAPVGKLAAADIAALRQLLDHAGWGEGAVAVTAEARLPPGSALATPPML